MGGESGQAEPNEDGCPGGWYRCRWAWSVIEYIRPVAEGVYSSSPRLDRTDDPLVISAVGYFEYEQSRHREACREQLGRK